MTADNKHTIRKSHRSLPPAAVLALGFFCIILVGSLLLVLPITHKPGTQVGYLEALFTATSATCVTGLTVVDTFGAYSTFGHVVIISLIQVGGLGFMLFATMTLVALGRRVSLQGRLLLRDTMSLPGLSGGVRSTIRFMGLVFFIELLGAIILSIRFVPLYGADRGIWYGVFHSVSAFCNAGFDLFGAIGSLVGFRGDALVLMTISCLIVLGGLGFAVIWNVLDHWRRRIPLSLHTKIVLLMTGILLLVGMAFFVAMEWNNPRVLAREGAGAGEKLLNAWFQSVTPRTAGYFSFPQSEMTDASKLVSIVLMFIGASPASTGGGIKTSTLFVVIMILRSIIAGREDINSMDRRIPSSIGRTAQSILFIYLSLLVLGAVLLTVFENGKGFSFLDMLFEEASALGTVGLTAVGTANFTVASKLLLITLMYFGRVGPLTLMLTLNHNHTNPGAIRFPEEQIIVG